MTGGSGPIRVLIVDDHPMLREGVAAVLEAQTDMTVAGEAATAKEAVEAFARLSPDVTLMDLRMPGGSGLTALQEIRRIRSDARVIMLTTFSGDANAMSALKAGAAGYLLKSSLRRELVDAIRGVHAGRRHLQAEIAEDVALHAIDDELTAREVEVLGLIASGRANKQIGRELRVSEDTVKSHVKSIFAKLHVDDRTHAVTSAARRGIIDL